MARVLHFIDTTLAGGAETVFLQVADAMRARGWEGRAVVVGPGWVLDSVRRLKIPVDVVPTKGRLDLRYLLRLWGIVRRHRIDLIHAHLYSAAVYASAVAALARIPVVATFHGATDTEPRGWGHRIRYRLIGSRGAAVCVSETLRDALLTARVLPAKRIHVIHNGVDPMQFAAADGGAMRREHGVPTDAILIGALGNMREAKDFPTLLRAARELAEDRRLAFAIAGMRREPVLGQLLELRERLGLSDRVSFWGFCEDPAAVLAAFDVLAISSSSEGFSLAAIQAMAAGTPVVATRSGGPQRIISHGRDGLLVPTRSPTALAEAIRCVIGSPELSRRLVAAGRRTVQQRFSLAAMLDAYEALYSRLLRLPQGGVAA